MSKPCFGLWHALSRSLDQDNDILQSTCGKQSRIKDWPWPIGPREGRILLQFLADLTYTALEDEERGWKRVNWCE